MLVGPGLVGPLRGLVRIGSWWVLGTLYFVTREELGQALERRSDGHLQLDP